MLIHACYNSLKRVVYKGFILSVCIDSVHPLLGLPTIFLRALRNRLRQCVCKRKQSGPTGTCNYGSVKMIGLPSVTAIVCSKCAHNEPSRVTTVQWSFSSRVSGRPAVTIGSMAKVMPGSSG